MFKRVLVLLFACASAACVLASATSASTDTGTFALRYTGLDAACPGLTTPPDLSGIADVSPADLYLPTEVTQTREMGTVPRWIRAEFPWIGVHNIVITTTLHAEGVDGAGTSFTVDGTFVNSLVGEYPLSFWAPGDYGRGVVTITREDGAKLLARDAGLEVPRWIGGPYVWLPEDGSVVCAGHRPK